MSGDGGLVFDKKLGVIASHKMKYQVRINEKNVSVTVPYSLEYRLLTDQEAAANRRRRRKRRRKMRRRMKNGLRRSRPSGRQGEKRKHRQGKRRKGRRTRRFADADLARGSRRLRLKPRSLN